MKQPAAGVPFYRRLKVLALLGACLFLMNCNNGCERANLGFIEVRVDTPEEAGNDIGVHTYVNGGGYQRRVDDSGKAGPQTGADTKVNGVDCAANAAASGPARPVGHLQVRLTASASRVIYVADLSGNAVAVLDATDDSLITSIPVGTRPRGLALTPDGSLLLVSNSGSASISVIDTATQKVVSTIALPAGSSPYGIAVTPDGAFAYVANFITQGSVFAIDIAKRAVLTTIAAGKQPIHVAVRPDGSLVYVANFGGGNMTVIDVLTNSATTTIPVTTPSAIATDNNGRRIFVTNVLDNGTVTVFDATTYAVLKTIPVGGLPVALAESPSGQYLFVANVNSGFVTRINLETLSTVNIDFPLGVQTLTVVE